MIPRKTPSYVTNTQFNIRPQPQWDFRASDPPTPPPDRPLPPLPPHARNRYRAKSRSRNCEMDRGAPKEVKGTVGGSDDFDTGGNQGGRDQESTEELGDDTIDFSAPGPTSPAAPSSPTNPANQTTHFSSPFRRPFVLPPMISPLGGAFDHLFASEAPSRTPSRASSDCVFGAEFPSSPPVIVGDYIYRQGEDSQSESEVEDLVLPSIEITKPAEPEPIEGLHGSELDGFSSLFSENNSTVVAYPTSSSPYNIPSPPLLLVAGEGLGLCFSVPLPPSSSSVPRSVSQLQASRSPSQTRNHASGDNSPPGSTPGLTSSSSTPQSLNRALETMAKSTKTKISTAAASTSPKPTEPPRSLHIACFGDSLTEGYTKGGKYWTPYADTMKPYLQRMLDERYERLGGERYEVKVEVEARIGATVCLGVGFWGMEQMMKLRFEDGIEGTPDGESYDWLVFLGGTNDIPNYHTSHEIAQTIREITAIPLDCGTRVLLCTIPETHNENDSVNDKRDEVNKVIGRDRRKGVTVLDLHALLPYHSLTAEKREEMWDDGVHFTTKGYQKMGELVGEAIFEAMGGRV